MRVELKWAAAYLAQAEADLRAAEEVGPSHISVFGMLLQMSFEKSAKAALLYGGRVSVEKTQRTHAAAVSLMKILKDNEMLLERVTDRRPDYWRPVVVAVESLTNFHPQVAAKGPWLEYPWKPGAGDRVNWPDKHLAPRLRSIFNTQSDPLGRIPDILQFAHILISKADSIFGG